MTTNNKARMRCPHCGAHIPVLAIGQDQFDRIMDYLPSRPSTAAAEISLFGECTLAEAEEWIGHLRQCSRCWPLAAEDAAVVALIDAEFGGVERPENFCDASHCPECRDHNDTLQARTVINIRREDLGVIGWDPISFTDAQGIGHLFPALARYALMSGGLGDYATQLAWHLSSAKRPYNGFYDWCSPAQRAAVEALLLRILETRAALFDTPEETDELLDALALWAA